MFHPMLTQFLRNLDLNQLLSKEEIKKLLNDQMMILQKNLMDMDSPENKVDV
jgi:hypothetical protein